VDALSIIYSGESEATLWIEGSTLTLNIEEESSFDLSDASIGDLSGDLNLIAGVTATLIADSTTPASELNEISREYPADIKSSPYFIGYGNYSNPKKISEVSHISADEIRNSWLDEADALIESLTGLIFREASVIEQSIDIRERDLFSTADYGDSLFGSNGLYLRRYAPIVSVDALEINGTSITPESVSIDYDRIILLSSSEAGSWDIGKSKAKVSLTYGYATGTREAVLASEFATLYSLNKLYESELKLMEKTGATKITHASVVFENDTLSEESIARKDAEIRMELILEHLPKKLRGCLG